MAIWFREITTKLSCLPFGEEGATTTEYAVIISTLVLAVIASIYFLANWDGTGILQILFSFAAGLIGQFGKVG